ncbi:MAG: DNA glycosylase AlkZ-like family protein, partial [Chloroflexota bacterium]
AWEVYKTAGQRRCGYYTLPILYCDRLAARADVRLERATMTLVVVGFWLEDDAPANDPGFSRAIQAGLERFAGFVEAADVDASAVRALLPGVAL